MPHIIVKLWPGKPEQQKVQLAAKITADVTEVLHYSDDAVSIAFEEIDPQDWKEQVYQPDVIGCRGKLYKTPGYTM